MSVTRTWKVYGAEGHIQRESFCDSRKHDFSRDGKTRILEILNSDKTGTNEYTVMRITRDTAAECEEEFYGQLWDGTFENCRYGKVEEVEYYMTLGEIENMILSDGWSIAVVSQMSNDELRKASAYDDYDEFTRYMKQMCYKYDR